MKRKIGFIGAGNMASAIYGGILSGHLAEGSDLILYDINQEKLAQTVERIGCEAAASNEEVVQKADLVFLAIKPQFLAPVLEQIRPYVKKEQAFISIVAGWTIEKLKNGLGESARLLRVMPNTPLLVGHGMSCLSIEHDLTQDEFDYVHSIFSGMGRVEVLPEKQIAWFASIAGSGPAYVYMFIEAMADAGCKLGLARDLSYRLAAQTCIGSGHMVLETGQHPGALKDAVCSPGGSTIEAVYALEKGGFRAAVIDAIDACTEKFYKL